MKAQSPGPPVGVQDLHTQPGMVSDRELFALRETLEVDLTTDVFDQLTQFIPDDEVPDEATDEYRERALEYVTNCIEYREEIRPDSLRELGDLPDKIDRTTVGGWVYYSSGGYDVEHDSPESDANTYDHGKYLFFTPETAQELEKIVVEQFQQRPYQAAKIPTKLNKKKTGYSVYIKTTIGTGTTCVENTIIHRPFAFVDSRRMQKLGVTSTQKNSRTHLSTLWAYTVERLYEDAPGFNNRVMEPTSLVDLIISS